MVFIIENLIGIGAVYVVFGGLGKRKIAGITEIAGPCKIIDPVGVAGGNFLGTVCGTGIDNDDFVHQIRNGIQTSG